jgi:arginase family enzyme
MTISLVVLRCRTSDRTDGAGHGAEALGRELGERLGMEPRIVGSAGNARPCDWADDLRESRGCILEAGGQVDDALARGAFPILLASDCSICLTTFAAVVRHEPEARFLWLDAHGDFNTPDTTPSGFLGGMCLAAACGRWEAGEHMFPAPTSGRRSDEELALRARYPVPIDPARVVMSGVRDLDSGERAELDFAGVGTLPVGDVADRLRGEAVYVHLDLDVLDPDVLPSQFPAPGGLSAEGLHELLGDLASSARIVGLEVTAFEAPDEERVELVAGLVSPVLEAVE